MEIEFSSLKNSQLYLILLFYFTQLNVKVKGNNLIGRFVNLKEDTQVD